MPNYDALLARGVSPSDLASLIIEDADRVSGSARYLALRAPAYLALYRGSGGNFAFALIAAHGAVWASWYVPLASLIVRLLAVFTPHRIVRLAAYRRYVDQFKEINRRVAVETYVAFHLTRCLPDHPDGALRYPPELRQAFAAMHEAARRGTHQSPGARRALYEMYFRWEQTSVVAPLVEDAVAAFNGWPLVAWFCQRPWVWFGYFPFGRALRFRCFSNANERISLGMTAYAWAERAGWARAERTLTMHPFYPKGGWCNLRDGLWKRRPKPQRTGVAETPLSVPG